MKSPFPGMDPYLEQSWRDVHHRFCTYACDALQTQIRPALLARLEERLVVEADERDPRSIYPDVRVFERRQDQPVHEQGGVAVAVAVAEPLLIKVKSEPSYEGFIQITDPSAGGRLVTVVELLSISNKTSKPGIAQYRRKQDETYEAGVSIVEIDLLRAGEWVLMAPELSVPAADRQPYRACVKRSWKWSEWEYYHLPIRKRLPAIRIPLREQDGDAFLDLQEIIDRVYLNGGYDEIDYSLPPVPPLDPAIRDWAAAITAAPRIKGK
jgi:hypothetical protein